MDSQPALSQHDSAQTRRRLLGAAGAGALGAGMLAAGRADAQLPNPVDDRYVLRARMPLNVRDFGATGDGSTNDTAAIQSAINAGAGGAVFLPPGRYAITGLELPSNTELFGAGWNSVLLIRTTPAFYPLHIMPGAHDVRLHDFAVDGNKAAIMAAHPTWDPDGLTPSPGPAVVVIADGHSNPCRRIYLERLRAFDAFALGLVFQSVVDGAITDCSVEKNNRDGITLFYECKNVAIRGNTIIGCADDHIGVNSDDVSPSSKLSESILITDNTIIGPSPRGKGPGITVRGGKDIVIANNVIRDVSQAAIKLEDGLYVPLTDSVISGNAIYRPGEGGSAEGMGIAVNNAHTYMRRLSIIGNMMRSTHQIAIRLLDVKESRSDDDVSDVLIANNSVEDSGQEGIGCGSDGISDVLISGNRVRGSAGDGIIYTGGKRIHVRDNIVYRNTGYGIKVSTGDGGSCEGNQVYDDRGASRTQTIGIHLNDLSGVWGFRDNTVWGHATDYDLHVGSHSAQFDGPYRTLFGSTGWNPPPLPDGAATTTALTVAGASVGDPCSVGFGAGAVVPGGVLLAANVTSANTVTVTLLNKSGSTVDVAGGSVWVHVQKPPPLA